MPDVNNLPLVPTGIEGLDVILRGGLVQGEVYIVQGPPGGGKTILGNQICYNHAARGGKALYIGLLAESSERMISFVSGMEFFNPDAIAKDVTYLSGFAVLKKEGLPGLLRLIVEEIKKHGASFAVLDGLFVACAEAKDDQEFREFVRDIQAHAPLLNCTMLLSTNDSRPFSAPELAMVDGWMQIKDEMHDLRAIRSITVHKQRGSGFLRGQHYFRIADAGISVFPRIESLPEIHRPHSETLERVSSGVKAFDTMLHGGYPCGSISVVYGPSGAGKTTLGLEFLSGATPEEPALYFGFYERPARIIVKAQSIGIDMKRMVENGTLNILWHHPAESIADALVHELLRDIDKRGVRRLYLDGINAFTQTLVHKERYLNLANALSNELRMREVTTLYGMENENLFRPENMGVNDLSALVDNVILVHYGIRKNILRRKISILKVRDSDFDPISEEFYVSGEGIRFGAREIDDRPKGALPLSDLSEKGNDPPPEDRK